MQGHCSAGLPISDSLAQGLAAVPQLLIPSYRAVDGVLSGRGVPVHAAGAAIQSSTHLVHESFAAPL
jgi:hypothetical protein